MDTDAGGGSTRQWVHAPDNFFNKTGEVNNLQIKGMKKYIALERHWWFWVRLTFGEGFIKRSEDSKPNELQFILACDEEEKEHMLILPLMAGDWRVYLRPGGEEGLTLGIHGGAEDSLPASGSPLLLVAKGNDPRKLIAESMKALAYKLGTFKLAADKKIPEFVNWFGWCTWDAFYQDVTAEKVLAGLETFNAGGIQTKFMILDDGWQDVSEEGLLNRFEPNAKFPDGLKGLTDKGTWGDRQIVESNY